MVDHLIALVFDKKLSIEAIGLFTDIVEWILSEELTPQQAIDILSDAIQQALPGSDSTSA